MENEKKPIYKKWWFWVILVVVIVAVAGSPANEENSNTSHVSSSNVDKKVEVTVVDFSTMEKNSIQEWCDTNKVKCTIKEEYSDTVAKGSFISQSANANSVIHQGDKITVVYSLGKEPTTEYKNALKQAESYSKNLHMSKQGIYDQLTSQYGGKFPADAAQYAIDNIEADWNANALKQAKSYQNNLNMSRQAIYDQLVSQYGGKFTAEEAQYAIDHLDD